MPLGYIDKEEVYAFSSEASNEEYQKDILSPPDDGLMPHTLL